MSIDCPFCRHRFAADPDSRNRCPACSRFFDPRPVTGSAALRGLARVNGSSSSQVGLLELERPAAEPGEETDQLYRHPLDTDPEFLRILARVNRTPPTRDLAAPSGAADETPTLPPVVAGYAIEREIGRGGMGTVYLARQESLDRPVALKVMSDKWADDAVFLARFVREAYAAAQLNHPNIVQVYDVGAVGPTRFFSMEYVPGRSLAELLRAAGKLDPETAVGYVLQAARGLKHAHDRGMIHRDVKPDNLLLSDEGIVKVADLGLVKTPDFEHAADSLHDDVPPPGRGRPGGPPHVTAVRTALGTPAYMSPEQCRDASRVDHRADVYSLGCTLYALVTGRPPFHGDTAVELMSKQAYEAATPPEMFAARVPKELSAVIQKMMAKDPGDRFQSMGEVVRTLEQWLGVHHAGTYSPREEQIAALEGFVAGYNDAPAAARRERVVAGFLSACLLTAVVLAFFGRLGWAFGVAGMVVQAAAVYFVLTGAAEKTYLFLRVRQFARGMTVGDWLVSAGGVVLFVVFLWVLGLFWVWAGFGLIGAGLAVALWFGLDRAAAAERTAPLAGCQRLLRKLRLQGLDEEAIRQFVAKFAGRHWEGFFEALFGFEAKLAARALLLRGGSAGEREKHAAWREPLVGFIDRVEKARREARERQVLVAAEYARLVTAGVRPRAARREAEVRADELLRRAGAIRTAESARRLTDAPAAAPNVGQLLAAEPPPARPGPPDSLDFLAWLVLGPPVRLALAVVLMAGCAVWVVQTGVFGGGAGAGALHLPGVPAEYTVWCDTVNVGWAGVLLLASLFFRGHRLGLLVLVGAGVVVVGHRCGIRTVEPIRDHHVALVLGTVLALVGYRLGRR